MGNFCLALLGDKQANLNILKDFENSSKDTNLKENINIDQHNLPTATSFVQNEEKRTSEEDKLMLKAKIENLNLHQFYKSALDRHNFHRKNHHVQPLKLNNDLCRIAQNHANELANMDTFYHSSSMWGDKRVGENLAIMIGKELDGEKMTDIWYEEIKNYDFDKPEYSHNTGYFTQLIWKDTQEVGFGLGIGIGDKYVGIANYYPCGNISKDFKENVLNLNKFN